MNSKKGFTLMELLIVIAVIVVLVSISIPVFTGQLEKAKETTDAANIRAAMAEANTKYQTTNEEVIIQVTLTQSKDKELGTWQYVEEINGFKTQFLKAGGTKAADIVINPIGRNKSDLLYVRVNENGFSFCNDKTPKNWLNKNKSDARP